VLCITANLAANVSVGSKAPFDFRLVTSGLPLSRHFQRHSLTLYDQMTYDEAKYLT
jgi:hypothetical protein